MRYPASEKAEIIQLVKQSHLPAKRTLDKLGIPRATFYRWYDRYREGGIDAWPTIGLGQTGFGIASRTDFSRYVVAWRLGPTMCSSDVTATLDQALTASGLDHITAAHWPRLLSDNGSSYAADDLARWLEHKGKSAKVCIVVGPPSGITAVRVIERPFGRRSRRNSIASLPRVLFVRSAGVSDIRTSRG